MIGGDERSRTIFAPSAIASRRSKLKTSEQFPVWANNPDTSRRRAKDVASGVNLQAVGYSRSVFGQLGAIEENLAWSQSAIRLDIEDKPERPGGIRDIELALIRGKSYSVRRLQFLGQKNDSTVASEAIDTLEWQFLCRI